MWRIRHWYHIVRQFHWWTWTAFASAIAVSVVQSYLGGFLLTAVQVYLCLAAVAAFALDYREASKLSPPIDEGNFARADRWRSIAPWLLVAVLAATGYATVFLICIPSILEITALYFLLISIGIVMYVREKTRFRAADQVFRMSAKVLFGSVFIGVFLMLGIRHAMGPALSDDIPPFMLAAIAMASWFFANTLFWFYVDRNV
jgi:hypothetical protein